MTMLLNVPITTAVTALVTPAMQFSGTEDEAPQLVIFQGNFTYGSGGTTAKAWVQTTFDDQVTWSDIAFFSFTTSTARQAFAVVGAGVTTALALTDGAAAATVSGFLGPTWRVKYTTTGTYAGGTTMRIDVSGPRTMMSPR